jgi:regulator of replication initiation timing
VQELQGIQKNIERERKELADLSLEYQTIQERLVASSQALEKKTRALAEQQIRTGEQDQRLLAQLTDTLESLHRDNERDEKDEKALEALRRQVGDFLKDPEKGES